MNDNRNEHQNPEDANHAFHPDDDGDIQLHIQPQEVIEPHHDHHHHDDHHHYHRSVEVEGSEGNFGDTETGQDASSILHHVNTTNTDEDDDKGDDNVNTTAKPTSTNNAMAAAAANTTTATKGTTRIRYSNDFKVRVLDELQVTHSTVAEMARVHKLPEATLRDWVKTKDKIITAQIHRRGSAKSNSRDNLQKVTDALRHFMDLNDRLGVCGMSKLPVTNAMIAKQGQEIKQLLLEKDTKVPNFLTEQERKTLNAFSASIWWSKKWARKHNLHSVGHRETAKTAASMPYQVPEIRNEYSRDHVFFVVDTMLFYKVLPTRSYIVHEGQGTNATTTGSSNSSTAASKSIPADLDHKQHQHQHQHQQHQPKKYLDTLKARISLFISANSSGTHKIPLTMITDEKNPPSFVAKRQKLFPCQYQEHAWANTNMLLTWWKHVFLPHIRNWTDEKVLLVLQKPSIVDLEDPQQQVTVQFLSLLNNNHNTGIVDGGGGQSITSFFEPPMNMLSVVKASYRYELLREVLQIYEERKERRAASNKAGFQTPGLKQGHLPHLQDCMRILDKIWTNLPASAISSEDEDGQRKKKRRKRRKKKETTEEDIIESEAMVFSDEHGTDDLIKQILVFFRKHSDIVDPESMPTASDATNPLDKAVAEVKSCFVNDQLFLKSNQAQLRRIVESWIGLEDSQDIRAMLQTEIMSSMKFRLIIGPDNVNDKEQRQQKDEEEASGADNEKQSNTNTAVEAPVRDEIALECASQLLECAVRLSKENPVFHDLASKLIEASDSAFVALREAKLPPEERAMNQKAPMPPKKRKTRTVTNHKKKKFKIAEGVDDEEPVEAKPGDAEIPVEGLGHGRDEVKIAVVPKGVDDAADRGNEFEGAVFHI